MHVRCPHCHQPVELVDNVGLEHIDCPSCGSHFSLLGEQTASYHAGELRTIGHFELLERLGMGQFGSVWKARDSELDREVAVKIPRQEQLSRDDAEMFLREARAAAQRHHPNIVSVHELGREGDTPHESGIVSIAGSSDGRWLVTGSVEGTTRVWDLKERDVAASAVVLRGAGRPLTISADGRTVVAGSDDGSVLLWSLDVDELLRRAHIVAGRELTDDERRQLLVPKTK